MSCVDNKRALDISYDKYYTLLQNSRDTIFFVDEMGSIVEANEAATHTYGYSKEELVGMKMDQIRAPGEIDPLISQTDETLENGMIFEIEHIKKSGITFPVEASLRKAVIDNSPIFLVIARDISYRKRLENELDMAEAYFMKLFSNSPQGIALLDNNDKVIKVNKSFENLFGFDLGYLRGRNLKEQIVPEHYKEEHQNIWDNINSGATVEIESVRRKRDGTLVKVYIVAYPLIINNKQIGLISTYRDITKMKMYEENILKYSRALEQSPVGVVITDINENVEYINGKFTEITGYTKDEIMGKNIRILKSSFYTSGINKDLISRIGEGNKWTGEILNKRKNDEEYWALLSITAIKNDDGQITNFIATQEDITDHKKWEMEFMDLYRMLEKRNNIENAVASISKRFLNLYDFDENIDFAIGQIGKVMNASRAVMLIFDEENLGIDKVYEFCNEGVESSKNQLLDLKTAYIPWWMEALQQGKIINYDDIWNMPPEAKNEKEILSRLGSKSILVIPMISTDKLIGFLGVGYHDRKFFGTEEDINLLNTICEIILLSKERKEIEKRLELNNVELSEALEKLKEMQLHVIQQEKMASIGQLSAGVAHEINNPLGFISSNFGTLKKYFSKINDVLETVKTIEETDENTEDYELQIKVNRIKNAIVNSRMDFIIEDIKDLFNETSEGIERISKIVMSLKNFSRSANGEEFEQYDLNTGIKNTLVIARNEIKYVADIELDLASIPLVEAIGGQINQVILNIIMNALHAIKSKYENEKGNIKISTSRNESFVLCYIEDNGIGMEKEIISKAFEPFFTTKPIGLGTGLGLSLSFDIIVNKHKGKLEINSLKGAGTKVIIVLPISQARA